MGHVSVPHFTGETFSSCQDIKLNLTCQPAGYTRREQESNWINPLGNKCQRKIS